MDSYDQRREELEAANLPLFHGFHEYLIAKRVGKRVSCDHIDRLEFFANVYLIDYQDQGLAEGFDEVSDFLGSWFIRKATWSDERSLLANVETFQKFYDYLHSVGSLDKERHQELRALIESSKGRWLRYLKRYNDPSIDIDDVWDPEELGEAELGDEAGESEGEVHLVLMLSGKAARHFKVASSKLPKADDFVGEGHWSSCWRCDLVAEHVPSKTRYFMLTNARTLYSIIVPNSDHRIESLVSMFSQILEQEIGKFDGELVWPPGGTFSLVRGQPRSLIGSQNELIRCALDLFAKPDPSLEVLCSELNQTPMFAIEEVIPRTAFEKHLAADPPCFLESGSRIIPFPGASPN
ncbi:hypothetical protein [Haloferula sp.]|uniref:hypothetical protein n=1 Tax=Haloferula sp. TaxID=2497595 RepID=UPI003C767A16